MKTMNPKYRLSLGIALILGTVMHMQGCTTIQKTIQSTAEDNPLIFCGLGSMVTGGAVWAGCHYLLGGSTTACVIGAVATAVADGLNCWWQLKQKIVADYDDTRKKLHYDPSQGYVVKILDFTANPNVAHPGDEVKISLQFALMSPNPTDEIKFERKITLPGDSKPRTEIITYQPGTWGIEDFPFKIDQSSPDGKVEIGFEIRLLDQNKQDSRTLCFNIVHGSAQPASADTCNTGQNQDNKAKTTAWFVTKLKKAVSLKEEPKTKSRVVGTAKGGEAYQVLETAEQGRETWYKIQLPNGDAGWISSKAGKLAN